MLYKITYTKLFKFWHKSKILPKKISDLLYEPEYKYDTFEEYIWISTTGELQPRLVALEDKNRDKPFSYIWPMGCNESEFISGSVTYAYIPDDSFPSIVELKERMSGSDYMKMLAYYNSDDDKSNTGLLEED